MTWGYNPDRFPPLVKTTCPDCGHPHLPMHPFVHADGSPSDLVCDWPIGGVGHCECRRGPIYWQHEEAYNPMGGPLPSSRVRSRSYAGWQSAVHHQPSASLNHDPYTCAWCKGLMDAAFHAGGIALRAAITAAVADLRGRHVAAHPEETPGNYCFGCDLPWDEKGCPDALLADRLEEALR